MFPKVINFPFSRVICGKKYTPGYPLSKIHTLVMALLYHKGTDSLSMLVAGIIDLVKKYKKK